MSSLECDRNSCKNIMCNRLILDGQYYICDDCWEELLIFKDQIQTPISKWELENKIREFMGTRPNTFNELNNREELDEFFNEITQNDKEDNDE